MGDKTQVPNELLASRSLNPAEKIVWMGIKQHDWDNGNKVFPSATKLAEVTGLNRRTVLRAVSALETKGFLAVTRANGKSNQYHLATGDKVSPVTECHPCQDVTDQCQNVTAPVTECHPKYTQEIDSINRHKKNIRPKSSKQEQLKEIQESFPEFQEKFPFRNVPQMYEQWVDWLEEKGKRPSNYKASFRNFLRPKDWETNLKAKIDARASPSTDNDWRQRFLEKEDS